MRVADAGKATLSVMDEVVAERWGGTWVCLARIVEFSMARVLAKRCRRKSLIRRSGSLALGTTVIKVNLAEYPRNFGFLGDIRRQIEDQELSVG